MLIDFCYCDETPDSNNLENRSILAHGFQGWNPWMGQLQCFGAYGIWPCGGIDTYKQMFMVSRKQRRGGEGDIHTYRQTMETLPWVFAKQPSKFSMQYLN